MAIGSVFGVRIFITALEVLDHFKCPGLENFSKGGCAAIEGGDESPHSKVGHHRNGDCQDSFNVEQRSWMT